MLLFWPTLACLVSAAFLTVCEFVGWRPVQWMLKPLAVFFFVWQALVLGAGAELYSGLILMGLGLSAFGDVLLLKRDRPLVFKLGMLSFGLAHIAYAWAFFVVAAGGSGPLGLIGIVPALTLSAISVRWLFAKVSSADRVAIGIYAIMIGVMVAAALMVAGGPLSWWIGAAALMFAISDVFVARDRFVIRDRRNALAITPLYFGAQCLFAISVL